MKTSIIRLISIFLIHALLVTGCSSAYQIKKIKNRWNIPENEDVRITLINGDSFDFQKDEFKVFNEMQVLKGLGIKISPVREDQISQVVIPLDDIQSIQIQNQRTYQYLITAGVIGGIGTLVYFLLRK